MSILRGIFLAVLTAVALAFLVGFIGFARSVHDAAPQDPLPEADAIVALTGGGTERLETGMTLLEEGRGRRLLISGVNPKVKDNEIEALLGGAPDMFACCVDLGRFAEDTLGNAAETAAWAQRNGFDRLIVVTDDYHMPRSIAELRIAMPTVTLIAYPVKTRVTAPGRWQADLGAAGRLGVEYIKYLLIRGREMLMSLEQPKDEAPLA
jgi:uncharacterized SAM-binding protein YcdF (DUF218 family)